MNQQNDDEEGYEAGRAVVREVLVNRLEAAGLKPPKGVTPGAHAKVMEHLVRALAYMAPDNLDVLAESVLTQAAQPGPSQGRWVSEIVVRSWAEALQPRPLHQHPIIASWLRSREGPVAAAEGYLVPLYRWLRQHRRPCMKYDLLEVRREGAEMQSRIAAIRDRLRDGRDWDGDRAYLAAYLRDEAAALQWVEAGNQGRAEKAAAEDGKEEGEAA